PHVGGQLTALYPEKHIYDVAGFPEIKAQDLVDNLTEQLKIFESTIVLNQSIEKVEKDSDDLFELTSHTGEVHYSRTIIITAGNGAFEPRRLNINTSEDFENDNLHSYVDDITYYADEDVMLLGGSDSAVGWVLLLETIADNDTLVHRRNQFRAHELSIDKLKASSVNILTPFIPTDIEGDEKINRVILQEARGEKILSLDVDSVLCNYGFVSKLGPIKDWGL